MGPNSLIRIVLSLAVIVSFFLPFFNLGGFDIPGANAWNMLYDTIKNISHIGDMPSGTLIMVGCLFIVFLSSVVIFIRSLLQGGVSSFTRMLPFLGIVVFTIYIFSQGAKFSEFFKVFGTGFYIMLIASVLLAFVGGTSRRVVTA